MSTTLAMAPPGAEEWVSGLQARRMLGIGYGALQRLAVIGKVTTLVEPGLSPRYRRDDLARLAGSRPAPGPAPAQADPTSSGS